MKLAMQKDGCWKTDFLLYHDAAGSVNSGDD
jgi:hypothetical protein